MTTYRSATAAPEPAMAGGAAPAGVVPGASAGVVPDALDGSAGLPRLLAATGDAPTAPALLRELGAGAAGRIIDLVTAAGLRGRGGAGFPTGRKLAGVAAGRRRAVVLVNGCESEITSGKDAVLLRLAPHLVLDGAVLAAHAVGADRVIIGLHRGRGQADRLADAVAQRTGDGVRFEIVEVPRRFVASEESALVHLVNAGDARPTATPPRVFERGVGGRPTLVDNVETLAHLAQIVRFGPQWFRALGTGTDPGTTLVTIGGAVAAPGVYEIVPGTRLGAVLALAGGPTAPLRAALVGGYFGAWVDAADLDTLPLTHDPAGPERVTLGAGAIVALPDTACGLLETARVLTYLAQESAGQCGPCRFGLPAVAGDLLALAHGRPDRELTARLAGRLRVIAGRGACRHPDGAVRLAGNALRVFAADVARHLAGRPCAGVSRPGGVVPLPAIHQRDGGRQ